MALSFFSSLSPSVFLSLRGLPNRPAKLHVLFLMLMALMFLVTVVSGYHYWLVAKNRSTLGKYKCLYSYIKLQLDM